MWAGAESLGREFRCAGRERNKGWLWSRAEKEIFVSPFLLATLKSLLLCWRLIRVLAFGMEASRGQRALRIDRSAEPHKKGWVCRELLPWDTKRNLCYAPFSAASADQVIFSCRSPDLSQIPCLTQNTVCFAEKPTAIKTTHFSDGWSSPRGTHQHGELDPNLFSHTSEDHSWFLRGTCKLVLRGVQAFLFPHFLRSAAAEFAAKLPILLFQRDDSFSDNFRLLMNGWLLRASLGSSLCSQKRARGSSERQFIQAPCWGRSPEQKLGRKVCAVLLVLLQLQLYFWPSIVIDIIITRPFYVPKLCFGT